MNKAIIVSVVLVTLLTLGVAYNKLSKSGISSVSDSNSQIFLTPNNTVSVTADEYHQNPNVNDTSYKSGEWTSNNSETYASLIKIDVPQLKNASKVTLHLKLSAYHNKDIFSKNKSGTCSIAKNFVIKKITSSWEPGESTYNIIQGLQKNGKKIGNFTINPSPEIGTYISIEIPATDLNSSSGFTIDQTDSSPCRVSFYGHTSDPSNQPYITF